MNTPETINIEKYAQALNNLIGVDSAYMTGDKDVDAFCDGFKDAIACIKEYYKN